VARERIDAKALSPQVAGLLTRLDRYLPWIEMAVDGAMLAPDLLGADGPRTYLILAQNNHELRATGGFISGVGELTVRDARLESLEFIDSYAVDNLTVPHDTPPQDLQHTLCGDLWFFRDSNWSADFPTSAQQALEIYARDRGVQADGVVALDLTALRLLLDALGPIQIAGSEEPVTGKNALAMLQEQWANPSTGPTYKGTWDKEWWLHRKDFMGAIAGAALGKLVSDDGVDPASLAHALKQALDEKHILVYLADPEASRLIEAANWDGALPDPSSSSDFLLIVDSNVGFNKADPNVSRSISYQVDLATPNEPQAQVTLTYHNRSTRAVETCLQEARYGDSYADMMNRCYWNYVRVYVPPGSRLLRGPGLPLPSGSLLARSSNTVPRSTVSPTLSEGDWQAWAAFFDLAPGAEQTLTFEYQLPAWVLDYDSSGLVHYRLRVQKQPGSEAVPLRVEISLPSGAELMNAVPADLLSPAGTMLATSTDLRSDREFEIVFREGKEGP